LGYLIAGKPIDEKLHFLLFFCLFRVDRFPYELSDRQFLFSGKKEADKNGCQVDKFVIIVRDTYLFEDVEIDAK
jgi:hypothetical protein